MRNPWTVLLYLFTYLFFSDFYRFNNGKGKKNIVFISSQLLHSRQEDSFSFYVPLPWVVALHKFTGLDQFTYQETPTIILLVHTDMAKHKNKRHTHRHACPRGDAQGLMVTMDGDCNYTKALWEKWVSEMRSSLPLSSQAAPSTKEHHCSREKDTVCVHTHMGVWCDLILR